MARTLFAPSGSRKIEPIVRQNPFTRMIQLENAIKNIPQGFCMFDADRRLIVCNPRYADIFSLPRELTQVGVSLLDILNYRVEAGLVRIEDARTYVRRRLEIADRSTPSKSFLELGDGRVFSVVHEPLPEGGWISTHEDITEQTRIDRELERTRDFLLAERMRADRASKVARSANKLLLDAFEVVPGELALWDSEDRYVIGNERYKEHYCGSAGSLAGLTFEETLRMDLAKEHVPAAIGREDAWIAERMAHHAAPRSSHEERLSDDRWMRIEERRTDDGGSIGIRVDITDLKRRQESFRLLFDSNPIPMWVYDRDSLLFLAVNEAAVEHYGYARDRFLAMTALQIRPEEDWDVAIEPSHEKDPAYQETRTWRHLTANGAEIFVTTYVRSIVYEGRNARLVSAIDITDRKRAEERIAHLAHHDPLTDLPNRAAFNERYAAALARAEGSNLRVALLSIDLDRFKEVNDIFGHAAGDELLCAVARRLRAAADEAFVARVGGDEFAMIAENITPDNPVSALANRLLASVESELAIQSAHIRAGLSIGVAIYPDDGCDGATLMANADAALYRAKAEGRCRVRFYKTDMDKRLRERHALRHDLSQAVEHGELSVHYQPQARVTGEIVGFEALLRWAHPRLGFVPPDLFISIAEESNLIGRIGEQVLRDVCNEAASWKRPLSVSVNLSPVQFQLGDLPSLVNSILIETGLEADRLELEITEGVLIADSSRALSVLNRLKALGVRIAMDDFGKGYSSLSYLQLFPFDKIKIDRAFIAKVEDNPQSAAIVRAILGLARGLKLPVLAEGVETEEELAFLAEESCDFVQGYLLGRPSPIASYAAHIG